jgi:predicted RNase H-like HicB family nuclease
MPLSNIEFKPLRGLLKRLGFSERIRGDHYIFTRDGVVEILESATDWPQCQGRSSRLGRSSSNTSWETTLVGSKHRYEIIIYWSEDDKAYIAEVPELPGCAADGTTYQKALAQAEIVVDEWIETAKELGRPISEPRGRLLFA